MSVYGQLCDEASRGEMIWRNEYVCPTCDQHWFDDWAAQCDDDCPACGARNVTPVNSVDVTAQYVVNETALC